jgi:hypothetical protein
MKKTILLTGAIRDIEEFHLIVDCILHKIRKYGATAEVIVSTWHEDICERQPFFSWLTRQGVRIIGSSSIDEGGPANVFRQWRTLEAGLSHIDENHMVLKGRTDKFLLRKDVIDAFLRASDDSPLLTRLAENGQLALEHISLSLPFMAKDMVYLGTVSAMRQILHYSVRTKYCADHIFNGIGPECFLWLEFCKSSQDVMSLIQKVDLRAVSNLVMSGGMVDKFDWSQLDPHVVALYRRWFETFDMHFTFLTDVLGCNPVPSWPIDEGSWRYQIGDRKEYEQLKQWLAIYPPVSGPLIPDASFLNSTREYYGNVVDAVEPALAFANYLDDIRSNDERRFSDIVLLRQAVIERELANAEPDKTALVNALHWNIRQRDRNTLMMVYDWLMSDALECAYLSENDQIFVIERVVDLFTFSGNNSAIEKTIIRLPWMFKGSASLRTRVAEYHFTHRRLYRALYWFILSYRQNHNELGVNHGLGCTLLDLGFPRIALRYLRRAHAIAPADQTASFTLIRALNACAHRGEGLVLLAQLTGELRSEAERILNG